MKRIEIPIIDRNDCNIFKKNINIDDIAYKLKNNIPLTYNELLYSYNIYNVRWINEMYNKYDYANQKWKSNVGSAIFLKTGLWHYYKYTEEFETIKVINDYLEHFYFSNIAKIFNCTEEEIATSEKQLKLSPNKYVILLNNLESITTYNKLKYISGNVSLEDVDNVSFPNLEYIGGDANFNALKDDSGLKKLRSIGGNAFFGCLKYPTNLTNLESIGGGIYMGYIHSSTGLDNLMIIGGDANFNNLTETRHLNKLEIIRYHASFGNLKSSYGLKNLRYVGDVDFDSLEDASSLENLVVAKNIYFSKLDSSKQEAIKKRVKENRFYLTL